MSYNKNFSLKEFEKDLKNGARNRSTREAARVLLDATPMSKKMSDSRLLFSEHLDPSRDPTLEEYLMEKRKKKGMNTYASEFVPSEFKFKKSARSLRKSKRISRKSLRKSRRVSRRKLKKSKRSSKKSLRKSKRSSRKSSRKSKRSSRKSLRKSKSRSRKSSRKSKSRSRNMCNNLLKKKIGINTKEYEEGRFSSRQQAIAVSYNQVKNKRPSCGKYFKRK